MGAGAPKENTNAEKWSLDEASSFFDVAIDMAEHSDREYDFIGEIARDLNTYKEIFSYLSDKFKDLKPMHKRLLSAVEANCFYNGKKQNIVPSMAIMNLKSNHGWTDRVDNTGTSTVNHKGMSPIQFVKTNDKSE